MARLKHLIEKARQITARISSEKKTLRERVKRIKESGHCLPSTIREIDSMRRNWRAQRLIEEIEGQLRNARNPKKRMELMACIAFVEYSLIYGHDIPKTNKELLQIYDELSSKAQQKCMTYVSCASNSEPMMKHAARNENPHQKN